MITIQRITLSVHPLTTLTAVAETMCNLSRRHSCEVEATFNEVRLLKGIGDGFNRHDIERVYHQTLAREHHKRVEPMKHMTQPDEQVAAATPVPVSVPLHRISHYEHHELVRALAKPGITIVASLTPDTAHQLHMAVGISGEAGELLDAVKKAAIYCKQIDLNNVIEELGDLEFYMEGLRQGLGITREQCLTANIAKLSKRFGAGTYSDAQAQARADKEGE